MLYREFHRPRSPRNETLVWKGETKVGFNKAITITGGTKIMIRKWLNIKYRRIRKFKCKGLRCEEKHLDNINPNGK